MLDASVLIAHLDAADALHERATAVLREAADTPFGASPLTLAEVLVGPARHGAVDRAEESLDRLGVRCVALTGDGPRRLAIIRAGTGLKLPDCAVVLAAEQVRGPIATFDDRLAAAARRRGLAVLPG